jgi:hypothetical protein
MPDATEFLVESRDQDGAPEFDHFDTIEEATLFLRERIERGHRDAMLYQRVPFEVQIGVTVKAPRKRRKTPSPADKPGSDTPTGPGNGEAGEPKGAASPSSLRVNGREESEVRVADPTAPLVLASVYSCEARFDGDPACPGPVAFDPISRGHFCGLHVGIPESGRLELHRKHASRNHPVRVAHAG